MRQTIVPLARRFRSTFLAAQFIAGLSGACVMTSSYGGSQTGVVTSLDIRASDGLAYFHLSGTASGRPTCAASSVYWMIKAENSLAGKQQLAMLLTALASGKTITVTGANTCSRWSDGEDVETLRIQN